MKLRYVYINDSSHIAEIAYDPESNTMYVKFISEMMYRYENVSPEIFGRIVSRDSVGAEFSEYVRFNPNIPYAEIKEMPTIG